MSDICLNLVTCMVIPEGLRPLDRIWSLEHWQKSLNRVQRVVQKKSSDEYQRFELVFDTGLLTALNENQFITVIDSFFA